ncbi:MAG: hypothetical protein JXQ99_05135 [Hyphomicrobiaceae bacterium]
MSTQTQFIEHTKVELNKLGEELSELDRKMASASNKVAVWSTEQMHQLRANWHECQAHVERLSAQSETSFEQAKVETERHWQALEAAVKTYREKLKI